MGGGVLVIKICIFIEFFFLIVLFVSFVVNLGGIDFWWDVGLFFVIKWILEVFILLGVGSWILMGVNLVLFCLLIVNVIDWGSWFRFL